MFSPPYGDCTSSSLIMDGILLFSSPYGDCTRRERELKKMIKFSPPCGDRTLNISQNTAKLKSRVARKYSLYHNDVLLR